MELLLRTPSGSRLYGLSNSQSDFDWIEIYGWDKRGGRQSINDDQDVVRTSFDRFMRYCDKGVPQYLEAMFSKQCEVNEIKYITDNYIPNMTNVRDTYKRTIKGLWMKGAETGNVKFKRHALRLHLNLQMMEKHGRFNPTLSPGDAQSLMWLAVQLDNLPELTV